MLEVKQINSKIDLIIESNKSFFIKITEWFVSENNFNKFSDYIKYAIENKYSVIRLDNGIDMCFIFYSKKATDKDKSYVYAISDKMSKKAYENNNTISIDIVSADKINRSKKIKQKDETEQWFNEM